MTDILSRRGLAALADFAASSVVLGLDYDGTLAAISGDRSRARLRSTTRRLLQRVARSYPCVVISGRAQDDLIRRLGDVRVWHAFGNHGVERWSRAGQVAPRIHEFARRLRRRLRAYSGVLVEDKTFTITVHYRHACNKALARQAIRRVVRDLPDLRPISGKQAVNLIPQGGWNKGIALQFVRRVLACDRAIYVGDDGTDEDAFASGASGQLLSIRVGASRTSRARYCLRSQAEIDRFLEALLDLRAPDKSRQARRGTD
jgi:trehalose-phosphatase